MLPELSSFPHWLVSSPRSGSQTSQQSCWSSYWKWRRQYCWSFPTNHMRYHCAHVEKIPQAHMQIPRLYLVDGICSCQSEASPPFLCDTVTLMAILLCCTPRRDSYRIQHSDNWCLVRIRSNWCRCLDLGCLQETVLGLVIEERVPETESVMKA